VPLLCLRISRLDLCLFEAQVLPFQVPTLKFPADFFCRRTAKVTPNALHDGLSPSCRWSHSDPRTALRGSLGTESFAWSCGPLARQWKREWSAENPETRANRFASDLLLPAKMFRARLHRQPVTFDTVRQLAEIFCTSITATAIRLVEYGELPAILVCSGPQKREWFVPNSEVKGKIFLENRPGKGSIAEALLRSDRSDMSPREVRSDAWFTYRNAANHWVHEDSVPVSDGSVLSLLWWKDETQLIEIDNEIETRGAWRSDFRKEE
jgi:hypothetical protein